MACFPKIDTDCPLGAYERNGIGSHCEVCDHAVVALDRMSGNERKALLAANRGPMCVSYKVERRHAAAFGVALAAAVIAGHAVAGDAASIPPTEDALEFVIVMGGVNDPADAEWVDESGLPELPVVDEPRPTRNTPAIVIKDPEPRR